jgi:predicted transcriptional regulator
MTCKPYTIKVLAQQTKSNEASINFCMLSLMDKGWVVKKEFTSKGGSNSRSKELYWANQEATTKSKELHDALRLVSPHELEEARQEVVQLQSQHGVLTKELALVLQHAPSNEDLENQLQTTETQVTHLEQGLQETYTRIRAAKAQPKEQPTKSLVQTQ